MQAGTVIEEKYRIIDQIGHGHRSQVYRAFDLRVGKLWAVKAVRRDDVAQISPMPAEVEFLRRLDHPAFPRIVDLIPDGDRLYIVMDYIPGRSLDEIFRHEGVQSEERVRNWMVQLCDALGYLHTRKPPVIYRDIKPANILVTGDDRIHVVDFGIAREYREGLARDEALLGTDGYAAPEQHGGGQTDARSDIYALGMTMIQMLTGVDPGEDPWQYKVHPLERMRDGLSPDIGRILNRCTAFLPEARYQSCSELLGDLQTVSAPPCRAERGGEEASVESTVQEDGDKKSGGAAAPAESAVHEAGDEKSEEMCEVREDDGVFQGADSESDRDVPRIRKCVLTGGSLSGSRRVARLDFAVSAERGLKRVKVCRNDRPVFSADRLSGRPSLSEHLLIGRSGLREIRIEAEDIAGGTVERTFSARRLYV